MTDHTFRPPEECLDCAWDEASAALPSGWYISSLRTHTPTGRWSASATLHGDTDGANYSGFGGTPAAALHALASRLPKPEFSDEELRASLQRLIDTSPKGESA